MMNIKLPPQEDIHEKIQRELKEETKRQVDAENRARLIELLSLLAIILGMIFFAFFIFYCNEIPKLIAVIVLICQALGLKGLNII